MYTAPLVPVLDEIRFGEPREDAHVRVVHGVALGEFHLLEDGGGPELRALRFSQECGGSFSQGQGGNWLQSHIQGSRVRPQLIYSQLSVALGTEQIVFETLCWLKRQNEKRETQENERSAKTAKR